VYQSFWLRNFRKRNDPLASRQEILTSHRQENASRPTVAEQMEWRTYAV
jgi:hypothetical protein